MISTVPTTAIRKRKVLIISDEPVTAEVWGFSLSQMGLESRLIAISDDILGAWEDELPDLIILEDFNKEDEELAICRQLRAVSVVPILYLTSKTDERFQLAVYEAGADDCISYPITPRLFQAKANAWLHRTVELPIVALDEVCLGGFRLSPNQRQIILPSGKAVGLTTLEFRLLYLLMSHPGKVFSPDEIIKKVWDYDCSVEGRLIKNHLYRLRRKIEPDASHPHYLLSDGYNGYKFQPDGAA